MVNSIDYLNEKRIFKHKIDEKINKLNLKRSSSELKTSTKYYSNKMNNNNIKQDNLNNKYPTGMVNRISSQINRSNSLIISTKTNRNSDGSSDSENTTSSIVSPTSKFKYEKSCNFKGNFSVEETETGIKIKIKQPHLISVTNNGFEESSEDSICLKSQNNKTSIKIYPLKIGRTSIGSDISNDIVLNGPGIEPEHCFIENLTKNLGKFKRTKENKKCDNSAKISLENLVTIFPIAKLCAVDGVIIDIPYALHTGT
jgi:hypothetical protein